MLDRLQLQRLVTALCSLLSTRYSLLSSTIAMPALFSAVALLSLHLSEPADDTLIGAAYALLCSTLGYATQRCSA